MKFYAILSKDTSGPALGVGITWSEAWKDAYTFANEDSGWESYEPREITESSYQRIKAGNPDAVTLAV